MPDGTHGTNTSGMVINQIPNRTLPTLVNMLFVMLAVCAP